MSKYDEYLGQDLEDDVPAAGSREDEEDERAYNRLNVQEAEEASDDEEEERPTSKKRKKEKEDAHQMQLDLEAFLSKMEATFEKDFEVVAHNLGIKLKKDEFGNPVKLEDGNMVVVSEGSAPAQKLPAVAKLRMLQEVESFLSQKKFHDLFINNGGLGVLKSWLEPYPDGSLPNVKVRTTILKCLQALPVDTRLEEHKQLLKRSRLGHSVMFYSHCPDETGANRRLAQELVQKWSRPVFFDQGAEEAKRQVREQQLAEERRQMVVSQEMQRRRDDRKKQEEEERRGKSVRIHALIPKAPRLDFVVNPGRSQDLGAGSRSEETSGSTASRSRDDFLAKHQRDVLRRHKAGGARALKPSVEGRNITLMD